VIITQWDDNNEKKEAKFFARVAKESNLCGSIYGLIFGSMGNNKKYENAKN
jgi:hypothetical protein